MNFLYQVRSSVSLMKNVAAVDYVSIKQEDFSSKA